MSFEKQVEVGSDLLGVVEILEPGFSLKRGRILRQLHMPSLQLAKFNLKEKKISLPEFVKITKTVIKLMNEAIKCMEDFDLDSTGNGNAKGQLISKNLLSVIVSTKKPTKIF